MNGLTVIDHDFTKGVNIEIVEFLNICAYILVDSKDARISAKGLTLANVWAELTSGGNLISVKLLISLKQKHIFLKQIYYKIVLMYMIPLIVIIVIMKINKKYI